MTTTTTTSKDLILKTIAEATVIKKNGSSQLLKHTDIVHTGNAAKHFIRTRNALPAAVVIAEGGSFPVSKLKETEVFVEPKKLGTALETTIEARKLYVDAKKQEDFRAELEDSIEDGIDGLLWNALIANATKATVSDVTMTAKTLAKVQSLIGPKNYRSGKYTAYVSPKQFDAIQESTSRVDDGSYKLQFYGVNVEIAWNLAGFEEGTEVFYLVADGGLGLDIPVGVEVIPVVDADNGNEKVLAYAFAGEYINDATRAFQVTLGAV